MAAASVAGFLGAEEDEVVMGAWAGREASWELRWYRGDFCVWREGGGWR